MVLSMFKEDKSGFFRQKLHFQGNYYIAEIGRNFDAMLISNVECLSGGSENRSCHDGGNVWSIQECHIYFPVTSKEPSREASWCKFDNGRLRYTLKRGKEPAI